MSTPPDILAHINMGKAWGLLQTITSTWTVSKVGRLNALAAAIRNQR